MFKTIAQRCALAVALILFFSPISQTQAQSTVATQNAVTGGDPQPTGEPPPPQKPKTAVAVPISVLTALAILGLA